MSMSASTFLILSVLHLVYGFDEKPSWSKISALVGSPIVGAVLSAKMMNSRVLSKSGLAGAGAGVIFGLGATFCLHMHQESKRQQQERKKVMEHSSQFPSNFVGPHERGLPQQEEQ